MQLADGLARTYSWIKQQLSEEADHSSYAKSTVVSTSAPRELGSLREADGKEHLEKAKQTVSAGFVVAGMAA